MEERQARLTLSLWMEFLQPDVTVSAKTKAAVANYASASEIAWIIARERWSMLTIKKDDKGDRHSLYDPIERYGFDKYF